MNDLIKLFSESAPWAVAGMLIAMVTTYFQAIVMRKERRHREEIEKMRMHQIEMMLHIKERRIEELHQELKAMQEKLDARRAK